MAQLLVQVTLKFWPSMLFPLSRLDSPEGRDGSRKTMQDHTPQRLLQWSESSMVSAHSHGLLRVQTSILLKTCGTWSSKKFGGGPHQACWNLKVLLRMPGIQYLPKNSKIW